MPKRGTEWSKMIQRAGKWVVVGKRKVQLWIEWAFHGGGLYMLKVQGPLEWLRSVRFSGVRESE